MVKLPLNIIRLATWLDTDNWWWFNKTSPQPLPGVTSEDSMLPWRLLFSLPLGSVLSTVGAAPGEGLGNLAVNVAARMSKAPGKPSGNHCAKHPIPGCASYDWCNMPHVASATYQVPNKRYELEYVEVIQRHHKRTPYSSNVFPKENGVWNCDDASLLLGLSVPSVPGHHAVVHRRNDLNDVNPFRAFEISGFPDSSCQFPQITKEGFEDCIVHGADLRQVYGERLRLSTRYNPEEATFRITNNVITSQVASGFLKGFYPQHDFSIPIPVSIQPSSMDSLEPTYSCPRANALRDGFTNGVDGTVWRDHLRKAEDDGVWAALDGISGVPSDDRGWHVSFDHYFDNMSAKQCHGRPLPCNINDPTRCVSQELAETVYQIGHWEYSYLYRRAPGAHQYSILKFGAWMLELKSRLESKLRGSNKVRYAHNIAHDGSISSLLGFLQLEDMIWPGMGSEVVFELYRDTTSSSLTKTDWYIRVLWSGRPMVTASPLGTLDMVPIQAFFDYIDSSVVSGPDLFQRCSSS